jgi:uncharacterized protein (DUF305 family)
MMPAIENPEQSPEHRLRRPVGPARAVTGAVVLSLVLTACAGSDISAKAPGSGANRSTASRAAPTPAATTADGSDLADPRHNPVDVSFAQEMIAHHRGAVTMSKLAPARASSVQVKDLAARIRAAQGPEIELMTSWLPIWGEPVTTGNAMSEMGHSTKSGTGSAGGMMTGTQLKQLKAATGQDFDRMFLQLMIGHHRGALSMARTEETGGSNPPAVALAKSIRTTQTNEIAQMAQLLKDL